ncbi:helix-turn-helix transcriptional regulator [Kribbella solani]|uniref:Transcriptional regulator with XRE-family HTH domain n=1 Tax=Kribbella solani TaxID=236067 RepID=A0A841E0H0_9ACTN|nr:helix-turn-helix transcriptional regulator [Kribbella solani]MBB5982515.1 transcriptional regulator with XRE-family HTH domain [Kribbella solani]
MGELGRTLHAWRDRVTPAQAGLPVGGRRRAPGLRREELAQLAGLSVDYVVRLEQGRAESPSVQVLSALARALRLSDAERNHLFVLAGEVEPSPGRVSAYIPPGVQRIVDQLEGAPLCVCDAAWTMITWNSLFAAMTGDPSRWHGRQRNIIYRHFTAPGDRIVQTPDQQREFRNAMVTDLRASLVRYPHDPELRALIEELRGYAEFARLWEQPVTGFHRSERKTIRHPEVGEFSIDCDVLAVPGNDLRIVVYTAAPGSDAAEKLRLLSVIGLQALT